MKIPSQLFGACSTLLFLVSATQAQVLQEGNTCKLVTYIPFTDLREGPPEPHNEHPTYGYGSWPDQATLSKAAFSFMAAAEMARQHFNDRNPVLVPELTQLKESGCSITMPEGLYLDSAYNRQYSVQQLQGLLEDHIKETMLEDRLNERSEPSREALCAVISPRDDDVAAGVAAITEALGVPQIAYASIGYRLSNQDNFPTFSRVIPEGEDFGETFAKWFNRDIWHREVAGIIYADTDYGEQFESPIEDAEDYLDGFKTITESVKDGDDESIVYSLTEAKENGFHTIVLILDRPTMVDYVARIAEEMGMLGEEYFWILSGDAMPPALSEKIKYEVDSPADKLLRGAALFTNYDRFAYIGENDPFLSEWKKQDGSSVVDKLNTLRPDVFGIYKAEPSYFQTEMPTPYASFMYDAVITAGISACEASLVKNAERSSNGHVKQVLTTAFMGASGQVRFKYDEGDNEEKEYENSRNPEDVVFGVYNVRPGSVDENNMRNYETVLTHLYSGTEFETEGGQVAEPGVWMRVEGTEFLFFDGTTDEPMPRRKTFNSHFLSDGVQILGLTLSSIALFCAVATGSWVYVYRANKIVKASQPEFLYLLCFGAALVAPSAFFMSFDESFGRTDGQLDAYCSAFPWFFVIGYLIMYCALFSKLWRLSQLLQLRRRVVDIKKVLVPFSLIIACSVIILVVWQAFDPLEWNREVISGEEEPYETYGECTSEDLLFFLIPLGVLIILVVGVTAVFSWKLKDVQSELSEARWIFAGIFLHIQTWLIGAPIYYITDGVSRDASYIMIVTLAFTFSTSQVALVIWPKMYTWVQNQYFGGSSSRRQRPHIAVLDKPSTRVSGISRPPSQVSSSMHQPLGTSSSGVSGADDNSAHQLATLKRENLQLSSNNAELESRVLELEKLLQSANSSVESADQVPEQHPSEKKPVSSTAENFGFADC